MEAGHRWSVTYTKHVKQKRKVYQDGFLELQTSRHKVMLYDEWEKPLDSRFVKKDEVINSGETLAFDSYLVDIGELCGDHKPESTSNCQAKEKKLSEKSESLHRYGSRSNSFSVDMKPVFGKSKGRVINLSQSKKMIRDFKKSEINRYGSPPSCMDMTKTTTTEWQVLYTTHVTQKAKKFHDGFIQLVVRGSQGRQVMLYDTTRRQLNSRFLKKDEIVSSGESLPFEGHLVEIGEMEEDRRPATESVVQGKNCQVVVKTERASNQGEVPTTKQFRAGKTPEKTSPRKVINLDGSRSKVQNAKLSSSPVANEPRRAVHDILSILRKPNPGNVVTMNKPFLEEHLESHSSNVHSNIKIHIKKEYDVDCGGSVQEELREKSDHDSRSNILKLEAIEVLIAAEKCTVSENGKKSQLGSTGFCLRSADGQTGTESGLTKSKENHDPEKSPEIFSEIVREPNSAAVNGLSSGDLPKLWEDRSSSRFEAAASGVSIVDANDCTSHDLSGLEERTPKQDFHTKEIDEIPSFDLGF